MQAFANLTICWNPNKESTCISSLQGEPFLKENFKQKIWRGVMANNKYGQL